MRLLLSPIRNDERITASVDGDVLTVGSDVMDFSDVEEGDFLPREACSSAWIAGGVTRTGGVIVVPLAFPVDLPDFGSAARRLTFLLEAMSETHPKRCEQVGRKISLLSTGLMFPQEYGRNGKGEVGQTPTPRELEQ